MKRSSSPGFTLIELVIVILIGSILTALALSSFQNAQARFAVVGAKQVYMTWHQRARSRAIETGETVVMLVYPAGDSTRLLTRIDGTFEWTDVQLFDEELGVDLRTRTNASYYMCMTPRGYADDKCGSLGALGLQQTYSDTMRLEFWLGGDSASVLVLPLGQLVG